ARELAAVRSVPAGLRGADALRVLQSDPAGEYLVTTDDRVVGVLRSADVTRLLRSRSSGQ
ncbi:MAG: peptidase M50, partial [Natronosporangium sp.]